MAGNVLSAVRRKLLNRNPCFLIGSHRVDAHSGRDYTVIINGLSLWVTLLLDQCSRYLSIQVEQAYRGRILLLDLPYADEENAIDLTSFLTFLDNCNDALISSLQVEYPFKGDAVRKYIRSETSAKLSWTRTVLLQCVDALYRAAETGECRNVDVVRELHQIFAFLKKLQVTRPDLESDLFRSYIEYEDHLRNEVVPLLQREDVKLIVSEMNQLARRVLADFSMPVIAPRHGPGAVSDPNVKSWFQKNLSMHSDARIGYLLRSRELGQQSDYCPWVSDLPSDRTSRFVGVPKTWKKLRGIAAEPVELQFYQQGVFHALDEFFRTSRWWRERVNLHDQSRSCELARLGSIHDGYATIDLSSASDSVTLELVKQVFKGTPILPWLLGTRSTHCRVGEQVVHLSKFASMGSACCFPTECMIFTLAAQVASDRTRTPLRHAAETVCVYGDDIIVGWDSASTVVEILEQLGFSVNTEKSYLTGYFREACGAECYHGADIRPIRYSALERMPGDRSLRMEDISASIALINALDMRGFHLTSRSLLELLLGSKLSMRGKVIPVGSVIPFSFFEGQGMVTSPLPTNFNLRCRWNGRTQILEYRVLTWRMRPSRSIADSPMGELFTHMEYIEWQINHQVGLRDWAEAWSKGYLDTDTSSGWVKTHFDVDVSNYGRLPIGMTMVPTCKWRWIKPTDILSWALPSS